MISLLVFFTLIKHKSERRNKLASLIHTSICSLDNILTNIFKFKKRPGFWNPFMSLLTT